MATQVMLDTVKLAESPDSSKSHFDTVDTEMTSPLTSIDDDSSPYLSSPKVTTDSTPLKAKVEPSASIKMDFRSARERDHRIRQNAAQAHNTNGNNGNNWRRQSNNGAVSDSISPFPVGGEGYTPITLVRPGPVYPLPEQLNSAFAYGIRRPDGSYTRLLPADELPELNHIPRHQGPEGLIIVPELRNPSPRPDVAAALVPNNVVARLPQLPPNRTRGDQHGRGNGDQTQMAIDTIVASNSPQLMAPVQTAVVPTLGPLTPVRREKIYCDKWVHEGTCAFTQVGCKYKHEMPMDKATQVALGLNHGVPNWYRRANGLSLSPPQATATAPINAGRTSQSWRRQEAGSMSGLSTSAGFNGRERQSSFGPIGPPATRRLTSPSNFMGPNSFGPLLPEEDEDQDSFRGRNLRNNNNSHGNNQGNRYQ